jgi:uncharacterized membrane protein YqjE
MKALVQTLIDLPLLLLWGLAMAVVGLLLLPLIAIVTISAAIVATYRHAELRVVYKGDADKRDRDAWKLR